MDRPLLPALPGYENPQLIAHGTTALVFRAIQTTLNRPVAIKVITVDTGEVPVNTARELATTVALSSQPHIVSIIDTGITDDERPYIVMEYCEGGSYAQIMRHDGALPVDDVVEVGITIGEALHAAHQAGIVHRDVKPSNILRSRFGPALTDFGIARAPDELGSTLTREMMTPHHASPEALLHQAQSGSSDIYSLASTMWTLLVGHPPFVDPNRPGMDMYAFRDRVLNDPLPAMTHPDVPEWLVRELTRAMAKLPPARHATAREFADALRRATLGLPPAAPESVPPQHSPPQPSPPQPSPPQPSPPPVEAPASGPAEAPASGTAEAPASGPAEAAAPSPEEVAPPVRARVAVSGLSLRTWPGVDTPFQRPSPPPPPVQPPPTPPAPPAPPASPPPPAPATPGSWIISGPRAPEGIQDPEGEDEGGWLGALATSIPQPAAIYSPPARQRASTPAHLPDSAPAGAPTHRFRERDLVRTSRRGALLAVLVAIGVVAVAAAAVLMLNAGRGRPPVAQPFAAPATTTFITAQSEGAPTEVRVEEDAGTAVTLAWGDPTNGTVGFLVVGKGPAAERLDPQTLAKGTTRTTITGLDPTKNYCFTVGAVYTVNRIATATDVCTSR